MATKQYLSDTSDALVSVVMVTCGIKDYARKCLESIKAQTYSPLELIVIDNSMNPAFAARLRENFPSVALHTSTENVYYGASLNKGIEISHGDFVLCLNDDIFLDGDFIRAALQGFAAGDKIGMVSGKVLRTDRKTLDSTGLSVSIWRTARERGYGAPDRGQFEKQGFVFGVSGAAAFYKRALLDDIRDRYGYFDARFLMFYEDLDVSWRANRRGWRAYYVPGALAYHIRGGSFRPDSGIGKACARRYLNDELHVELIKNRYLAIRKNDRGLQFFLHIIPALLYDAGAWVYVLLFRPRVARLFIQRRRERRDQS